MSNEDLLEIPQPSLPGLRHAIAPGALEMTAPDTVLAGRRILILEDEALVSLLLEDMVEDLGAELAGSFSRLDRAMAAVQAGLQIDVALLDVNVDGQRSFPLAELLAERGAPFVFTTGYDRSGLPEEWRDAPSLRKPFLQEDVRRALLGALQADVAA